MKAVRSLVALPFLFAPVLAFAQDGVDETEYVEAVAFDEELDEGLRYYLGVEASLNIVSNQNLVGQNDGTSILLGGGLEGGLDWVSGAHVIRNTLTYSTSWARTPVIEQFVKNSDALQYEGLYNYYVLDWLGPFARADIQTSLMPTDTVSSETEIYRITEENGAIRTEITDELRVAEAFRPLSLFESVGVAMEPIREEAIRTVLRVGFGARQTFASGVVTVDDEAGDDGMIQGKVLSDTFQAGAEAFLGLEGRLPEQRIRYRLGATTLIPFINNDDTGRSPIELARVGLAGNVRVNIFEWLGLTYNITVLRDPQLIDKLQTQNSLLLTFNYSLFDTTKE